MRVGRLQDVGQAAGRHEGTGRPRNLCGSEGDWTLFSFKFESYCALLGWDESMERCANELEPVVLQDLPEVHRVSVRQLYHLLVQLCEGARKA